MIYPSVCSPTTTNLSDPLPTALHRPGRGFFYVPCMVLTRFESGAGVWADNPIVAGVLLLGASVRTRGVQVRQAA